MNMTTARFENIGSAAGGNRFEAILLCKDHLEKQAKNAPRRSSDKPSKEVNTPDCVWTKKI
jgi:hypothetical protein